MLFHGLNLYDNHKKFRQEIEEIVFKIRLRQEMDRLIDSLHQLKLKDAKSIIYIYI